MAYLTNATDTHVQGVSVATSSIQDLGCQLHDQVMSACVTLECAGGSGIIVSWKPLVVTPLILDIIVGRALLSPEILCIGRAVLETEKGPHAHPPVRWDSERLDTFTRAPHDQAMQSPHSFIFFF